MEKSTSIENGIKLIEIKAKEVVDRINNPKSNDQSQESTTTATANPIPNPQLKGGGGDSKENEVDEDKTTKKLIETIQNWIKESDENEEKTGCVLRRDVGDIPYYLYSIEGFIRHLPNSTQRVLAAKLTHNLLLWLKELFHFDEIDGGGYSELFVHWEKEEGIISLTKYYLNLQFPNYILNGYESFEDKIPIIYTTDEDIGLIITSHLGLSKSSISVIDTINNEDWPNALQQLIEIDKKRNLTPIVLLLNIAKCSRNLEKVITSGEINSIPVHLFGRNLFSYFVKRPESTQIGNSFTIDLNTWIPSPTLPIITIYKKSGKVDPKILQVCGLNSVNRGLTTLVPWFTTQEYGHTNTRNFVEEVSERGQFLLTILKKYDFLDIIPNWTTLSDGQVIVSSLIFKFNPKCKTSSKEDVEPNIQYVNVLNSWLYHILDRDLKGILDVEFVDIGGIGWNILLDVYKTHKLGDEVELEELFDHHMSVLRSTVSKKSEFHRLVSEAAELEEVDYDKSWAGLGSVRYIPKCYRSNQQESEGEDEDSMEHRKSNINHLNAQIVDKLKSIDNAFSLGVHGDGNWCVQFGMVTDETGVNELIRLVTESGEQIEESSEFLNEMSELVKRGIVMATEELKRESEEALWEEGLLRKVPIVGTFVNWLSPPQKETGIRGRALNLVEGKVESTENIYKFHMQLQTQPPQQNKSNN